MRAVVKILKITKEAVGVKTLRFHHSAKARSGQFVMLWLPGKGEVPMSLSYVGELKGVTVKAVGTTTKKMHTLQIGNKIGVRGPYGRGYTYADKILAVAGGTGVCSIAPAVEHAKALGCEAHVMLGARSADELIMVRRLEPIADSMLVATDDGSEGKKGQITDFALPAIAKENYDLVWVCGPELMVAKVVNKCLRAGVNVEASLERYMKCAIGICGSCAVGKYLVCKDGPVFTTDMLREVSTELGRTIRDSAGRPCPV